MPEMPDRMVWHAGDFTVDNSDAEGEPFDLTAPEPEEGEPQPVNHPALHKD